MDSLPGRSPIGEPFRPPQSSLVTVGYQSENDHLVRHSSGVAGGTVESSTFRNALGSRCLGLKILI